MHETSVNNLGYKNRSKSNKIITKLSSKILSTVSTDYHQHHKIFIMRKKKKNICIISWKTWVWKSGKGKTVFREEDKRMRSVLPKNEKSMPRTSDSKEGCNSSIFTFLVMAVGVAHIAKKKFFFLRFHSPKFC